MLAGANPGAFIDDVVAHGDGESGMIVGYDEMITSYLSHADSEDEKKRWLEKIRQMIIQKKNPDNHTEEKKDEKSRNNC